MVDAIPSFATPKVAESTLDAYWEQLVPLLAGRPVARVINRTADGYHPRDERKLGPRPSRPAAVMLHDKHGQAKVLAFDLDYKLAAKKHRHKFASKLENPATKEKAQQEWVKAARLQLEVDTHRITEMIWKFGLNFIMDTSVSGGSHIYVPVAGGVSNEEAYRLLNTLKQTCPSIDPSPHRQARHGCLRMPGSAHKRGGHQVLLNNFDIALQVAQTPGPREGFEALLEHVLSMHPAPPAPAEDELERPAVTPIYDKDTPSRLSYKMLGIARDGHTHDYASPSEARFALLRAATNLGLGFTEIFKRMNDGTWPGLRRLFAKYGSGKIALELKRELGRLKNKGISQEQGTVHKNNTSRPNAQGGYSPSVNLGFRERLKIWQNSMHLAEKDFKESRSDFGLRMVLRALGEAASKVQSTVIEFGCRSLALATGLDHTTVSRHLKTLREAEDPLLRLIERGRGKDADKYELLIPGSLEKAAEALPYRKGRFRAVRPVFRALGMPAAFVYEALEAGRRTVAGIMLESGLGRSSVQDALAILDAHGLAAKEGGAWRLIPADLVALAEQLGAMDSQADQRQLYALQRRHWIIWLTSRRTHQFMPLTEDYPFELFEPPLDPWETPPPWLKIPGNQAVSNESKTHCANALKSI